MNETLETYDKIAKNQSESSLFHLAGDSIITYVLCAIFLNLLDNNKTLNDLLNEFYTQMEN